MTDLTRFRMAIGEQNDVEVARREARRLARELHFDREDAEAVALAVSELATNLVRYATRGEIEVSPLDGPGGAGIAVESRDQGPGMADPGAAIVDGFSTAGGLGTGLGGVRRLMDEFELTSDASGTTVVCRKWRRPT